ncbi:MAG: signal peptidase I [Caldilineaceae bacterium]
MADGNRRNVNEEYVVDADFRILNDASAVAVADTATVEGYSEAQPNLFGALLRELIETVVLSLILFLIIRQVIQNYRIESTSMLPNFHEGQFVLVNKLAFKLGEPHRGEVIVFHNPEMPSEDFIKRIIGLPGDTVEIRGTEVYIDGKLLPEPFNHNLPTQSFGPVSVEPNTLFVMGDNRPNSKDSRVIGAIPEELLVGKAWLRVWPLSEFGFIQHYDLQPGEIIPTQ